MDIANDEEALSQTQAETLTRPQRRLLRRIYNGRTVPIVVDEMPFLTFKEASRYLLTLSPEARETAYGEMRKQAK